MPLKRSPLQAVITASALVVSAAVVLKVSLPDSTQPTEACVLTFDGDQRLDVPVARTVDQMQRGLSRRVDVGTGMLFSWPDDAPRAFWMKDTRVPLSIAFLDAGGVVLQIEHMAAESEQYHWGNGPVRDALEVPHGAFQRLGISVGSKLVSRQCRSLYPATQPEHATNTHREE